MDYNTYTFYLWTNITCRAIVSICEVCIWPVGLKEWVTSTEKLGNHDKYLDPISIELNKNIFFKYVFR